MSINVIYFLLFIIYIYTGIRNYIFGNTTDDKDIFSVLLMFVSYFFFLSMPLLLFTPEQYKPSLIFWLSLPLPIWYYLSFADICDVPIIMVIIDVCICISYVLYLIWYFFI